MRPPLNVDDYRRAARGALPRFVFDYVDGAADDEACIARNRRDLDSHVLVPRVLRDTSCIDTSITLFGSTWRYPIAVAPTGLNGLVRPGGDALLAGAAAAMGVPFTLSTASNQRLEKVRQAAPAGVQWLQLYVMQDRSVAEQLVARAKAANYQALVLTVDVPVSGNRERDNRNGFKLPMRPTPALAWDVVRHPRWALRQVLAGAPKFVNLVAEPQAKLSAQAHAALLSRSMDRTLVWDSLRWLRTLWQGPLLLKGVLHPADAALALHHGVDGLIVSNHGGRQFDAAPSAISALPAIIEVTQDRIPVLMDSGIRRGNDVVRALSLGAKAVLIGRPALYGLAGMGQEGACSVIQLLGDELARCMALLGAAKLGEIGEDATFRA